LVNAQMNRWGAKKREGSGEKMGGKEDLFVRNCQEIWEGSMENADGGEVSNGKKKAGRNAKRRRTAPEL